MILEWIIRDYIQMTKKRSLISSASIITKNLYQYYFSIAKRNTKNARTRVNGVITIVSKPELEAKLPNVLSSINPNNTHKQKFTVLLNLPLKTYPAFTAIIEINSSCTMIDMLSNIIKSSLFNRPPQTKSCGKIFRRTRTCIKIASVLMVMIILLVSLTLINFFIFPSIIIINNNNPTFLSTFQLHYIQLNRIKEFLCVFWRFLEERNQSLALFITYYHIKTGNQLNNGVLFRVLS